MLIDLKEINTLQSLKKLGGIQEKMTTKKNEFCQKFELVASQINWFKLYRQNGCKLEFNDT